jgi:hypothetical protein
MSKQLDFVNFDIPVDKPSSPASSTDLTKEESEDRSTSTNEERQRE